MSMPRLREAQALIRYQLQVLNRAMAEDRPMLNHAAILLAGDFVERHGRAPGPLVVDVEIVDFPGAPAGTRFLVATDA